MEFVDDAIVLSGRSHGETHAVIDVLTAHHGRWAGLVYGGQGRKMRPIIQSGNGIKASWKGRLAESLGHFSVELEIPRAAHYLDDRLSLAALSSACAVARETIPEREAHGGVYQALCVLFDALDEPEIWPALMAKWELGLLAALGFGLRLDKCAATGEQEDLVYVSPRSASAVSRAAGEPYKDRMLGLPAFFREPLAEVSLAEAISGLETTGYFLETRILHTANKALPEARTTLLDLLRGRLTKEA
ncbi:MAG: DNA repair protein RecO [Pseudomonadota bacterium]